MQSDGHLASALLNYNTPLSKHRHCSFLNSPLTETTNDITSSTHVAKWNPNLPRNRQFPYPFAPEEFLDFSPSSSRGSGRSWKYPILVTILGH
ncbi:hypothetical protein CDAR_556941 [Caerostris darwini]|uniref:Uncharacterized protein n=1 Tax=Caerostris darwini TaxID=1538125 RepID=A0AAV4QG23_9ARAC|nr:hypothetical protein CDAR_556941 [Caerostris darwini]